MAKPNYRQQKKQREAARKQKHTDKLQRRQSKPDEAVGEATPVASLPDTLPVAG